VATHLAQHFDEHVKVLSCSEKAFSGGSRIELKAGIAGEQDAERATCFNPYCDTGFLEGNDFVMRFRRIGVWYDWATLRPEVSSSRGREPNVFFKPPARLLHRSTPSEQKPRFGVYLYSESCRNTVFEVVPLTYVYHRGARGPPPHSFQSRIPERAGNALHNRPVFRHQDTEDFNSTC